MQHLVLERQNIIGDNTPQIGTLYLAHDSVLTELCRTLEPPKRMPYGCVMPSIYPLSLTYSPKFRTNLPLLSVPSREGIRIHAGNVHTDSLGCILVGVFLRQEYTPTLVHSCVALRYLLDVIKVCKVNQIEIRYVSPSSSY